MEDNIKAESGLLVLLVLFVHLNMSGGLHICTSRMIMLHSAVCPINLRGHKARFHFVYVVHAACGFIRESVDSLCRDDANVKYMQYLKQKPYNFTTNMLKAYLSTQASSLSAFVISKTHIDAFTIDV